MSEQALDLRRSLQIVRRHRVLVSAVTVLGLAGGVGLAALHPPMRQSQTEVVLPLPLKDIRTQVAVAASDPVLRGALPDISPPMSLQKLKASVHAQSETVALIQITAGGTSAAQAESAANAVARSYIAYISSKSNPASVIVPARGNSPAKYASQLGPASTATGMPRLVYMIILGVAGALLGLLIGAAAALVIGRSDQRLRERDEISDAVGVPVVASVLVGHPADSAGWAKLLAEYDPGPVDAWRLRRGLQHLGVGDVSSAERGAIRKTSLAILSISSDPGALALGPQLAVFASSLGIRTALVIGPQQDLNATATLRAACAVPPPAASIGSRFLQIVVRDQDSLGDQLNAELTIVVVVVDGKDPQLPRTVPSSVTVLGVSAGVATAEELASVAVCAASDGRQIGGIIVADPERTDRTTGRLPAPASHSSRRPPTRRPGFSTGAGR
jgi:capsular polysaccharide biosynthesis protein